VSTRPAPARRPAVPTAALLAGLAAVMLTGCAVGQQAQTYQEKAVADATNNSVGAISVRNLAIAGPSEGTVLKAGSDAPMSVSLINSSTDPDELLLARTPAASSVDIVGPGTTVPVPGLQAASPAYSLVLRGLTQDLPTGTYVSLTLSFARNGTKELLVPVQVTPGGVPRPTGTFQVPEEDSAGKPVVR